MSDLGTFVKIWGLSSLVQEQVNDINLQFLYFLIDANDLQTPLNLEIAFETGGPVEVTGNAIGSAPIDLIKQLSLKAKLTLRPDLDNGVVDLMGWMQDIIKIQVNSDNYNGIFLGNQKSGSTDDYDGFVQSLIDQVYEFDISEDISLPIIADLAALK
jgi:hypothetical protein